MSRTRVRRRRIAVVLVGAALAAAWAGPVAEAVGSGGATPATEAGYVVRAGDTLWSIAEGMVHGQDPRPLVDSIAEANEVDPGALIPGQILVIPSR